MKQRYKTNKKHKIDVGAGLVSAHGITLIALVITIVILIILAGVAINLTIGENGIFNKAEYAKEQQKIELAIVDIQADKISKGEECTVDTIISELPGKVSGLTISKEGDNAKGTYNGCDFTITPDLKATIDGYTPSTGGSGQQDTNTVTISDLKAGDYIKYDTGVEGIGVITCRVLYEASSEHGLQIISDKNVGTDITLGGSDWATGSASYNSAIETLNNEAEKYINTTYATDARCVGSVPTVNANGTFTEKDTENAGPVTLQFNSTVEGANNMKDTDTNYTSNGEEGIVRDKETMEALGIWTTGEYYWLASRTVYSSSSDCVFYVRCVYASGDLDISVFLCIVYSDGSAYGDSCSFGLRPCFSLKSDITITGGDGKSEATAYTM